MDTDLFIHLIYKYLSIFSQEWRSCYPLQINVLVVWAFSSLSICVQKDALSFHKTAEEGAAGKAEF